MIFSDLTSFEKWLNSVQGAHSIYIVGGGQFGEKIGRYMNVKRIAWNGYVDKNCDITSVLGKPVIRYEDVQQKTDFFVVSSPLYRRELEQELRNIGIAHENIVLFESGDIIYEIMEVLVGYKAYTKKLTNFHGKYQGSRCFIVGNGPSLRLEDLENLKGEVCFASNNIYKIYPHTKWRPHYYCVSDAIFAKRYMSTKEDIETIMDGCEAAFTHLMLKPFDFREEIENLFFYRYLFGTRENSDMPLFSSDCSRGIYGSATITYLMLQLAVYMGFREIYLLGVDCSYSSEVKRDGSVVHNDVKDHHEIIGQDDKELQKSIVNSRGSMAFIDRMLDGYQSAEIYAKEHGVKIYNATRGGKLEVFERVDFDTLF